MNDAVRESFIQLFMSSLRRRAMAVIHFVSAETYDDDDDDCVKTVIHESVYS